MAESSGLWTTNATPAGHAVVSYTQALASDMLAIAAACSGYEGVAPGYLSELAPSTTGAFTVRIAAGGAMVDGKYYKNTANVDKTLDTPTAGTTRIDRVVVEATWATPDCVITVIKGTESGGTPSAPSIPSTAGTNYAIQICQALVNNAGDVTITDERTWAITPTDDSTLEDNGAGALRVKDGGITLAKMAANSVDSDQYVDGSIDTAHLADDAVDDIKVGNRVPQFYRRQGGSATIWTTAGTSEQTPTTVRMQAGAIEWTGGAAAEGTVTVTFPTAFSYAPLVFTQFTNATSFQIFTEPTTISTTQVVIKWYNATESLTALTIYWLAIGPQ